VRASRGAALVEFALVWPLLLLLVLGGIELALWSSESFAARAAAAAGARAGATVGASPAVAQAVALAALQRSLVGVRAAGWCATSDSATSDRPPPPVWVCATTSSAEGCRVRVGGSVPALLPGRYALPLHADVTVPPEVFE
jgi:Flp pilus assembly protein TadG